MEIRHGSAVETLMFSSRNLLRCALLSAMVYRLRFALKPTLIRQGLRSNYWTFLKRIIARLAEVCRRFRPSDLERQPPLLNPTILRLGSYRLLNRQAYFRKCCRTFAAIWRSVILSTVSIPMMRAPSPLFARRFSSSPFASPGPKSKMDSASRSCAITSS